MQKIKCKEYTLISCMGLAKKVMEADFIHSCIIKS